MSFDWTEYLRLAEELAGLSQTPSAQEAKFRSAVSRAYYAAYCHARNRLGFPMPPHVQSEHTYVWNEYRRSADIVRKQIGKDGALLRRHRNKADYDDTVVWLSYLTEEALQLSNRIILQLRQLP